MGKAVTHFEIVGKDGAELRSFYSAIFGWQIDAANPMNYGIVSREGNTNADGAGIGGGIGQGPDGYEGHVTFYIEVDDVEATLAQAASLGGSRVMGPHEVPGMGIVLGQFKDPEGHMIGLVQAAA